MQERGGTRYLQGKEFLQRNDTQHSSDKGV